MPRLRPGRLRVWGRISLEIYDPVPRHSASRSSNEYRPTTTLASRTSTDTVDRYLQDLCLPTVVTVRFPIQPNTGSSQRVNAPSSPVVWRLPDRRELAALW